MNESLSGQPSPEPEEAEEAEEAEEDHTELFNLLVGTAPPMMGEDPDLVLPAPN